VVAHAIAAVAVGTDPVSQPRAFVYVVCGGAYHIRMLGRSLEALRPRTALPIIVVTDASRNELAIDHPDVVDVPTPGHFDHHQASIFLKTSLPRRLSADRDYAYLDTDVIAAGDGVDSIFDHHRAPVTFAHDLTRLEGRVAAFSPWAVRCGCPSDHGETCSHLSQAIAAKFGVTVLDDWLNWNGGVFVFGPEAGPFMDMWHGLTMEIFQDPYWRTRDQATLIATVWKLGLQRKATLPPHYNFMVTDTNPDLRFDRGAGYSLHRTIPGIWPIFLHLCHADRAREGWTLAADIEDRLEARTRMRAAPDRNEAKDGAALQLIAQNLAPRRPPAPPIAQP
jgi:hypothetical protein